MQTRSEILSTLSPAHRQLLANVVGSLAIAQTPDFEAAARQLDSSLSAGERSRILSIHQNFVAQSKALRESMRARFESQNPGEERGEGDRNGAKMHAGGKRVADAGHILLGMAIGGGMHHGMRPGR